MLQISEIVKQTEDMFDLFNGHFYNGELTRPALHLIRKVPIVTCRHEHKRDFYILLAQLL